MIVSPFQGKRIIVAPCQGKRIIVAPCQSKRIGFSIFNLFNLDCSELPPNPDQQWEDVCN